MKLYYIFVALVLVGMVNAFTITSPEATTYKTSNILFNVEHNTTLDSISYTLDNSTKIIGCTDCSEFSATLDVKSGEHLLTAFGIDGDVTINDSVKFGLNMTRPTSNIAKNMTNSGRIFRISIKSPLPRIYYDNVVKIGVKSDVPLDSLYVELGSKNWMCTNCSELNESITLGVGDYSLKVRGTLDSVTKNSSTNFNIREKINNTNNRNINRNLTPRGGSNESRYGVGYEKLPQMVAAGELTDIELVSIIRNNELNPGVLNRLIKTRKLGSASINAILDTQFQPQGIFKRLIGWMGFRQNTYSELIVDNYNLTIDTKRKLVERNDLSRTIRNRINSEIETANNRTRILPISANRVNSSVNSGLPIGPSGKVNGTVSGRSPTGPGNRMNGSGGRIPPRQTSQN